MEENIFSSTRIAVGSLQLACVKDVSSFNLVLSLPHTATGIVPASLSTPIVAALLSEAGSKGFNSKLQADTINLGKYFQPGQYVPCRVMETSGNSNTKFKVSLLPDDVNRTLQGQDLEPGQVLWACVSSQQDYGMELSLGIKDCRGFIKTKKKNGPKVGLISFFSIISVKACGRLIEVVEVSDFTTSCNLEPSASFTSLFPGVMVQASIEEIKPSHVVVKVLSSITGSIHAGQVTERNMNSFRKKYMLKQKVSARVISVDPNTKRIGLSMLDHLMTWSVFHSGSVLIGSTVSATVFSIIGAKGVMFSVPDSLSVYIRRTHLKDEKINKIGIDFQPGTEHQLRIIDISLMDALLIGSLKTKVMELPFLRYSDLQPGMVIKGKILSVNSKGIVAKVTGRIRGFCPLLHVSDVTLRRPEKKFSIGKKLRFKVLHVESSEKRLLLTLKKSLLDSDLPIITSYQDIKPGLMSHGYVLKIKDNYALVSFFNRIMGKVTKNEICHTDSDSIVDALRVGQVVKCVVLSCNPERRRLVLSLKESRMECGQDLSPIKKKKPQSFIREYVDSSLIPSSFGDIVPDNYYIGTVHSIKPFGIFVNFATGLFGLVPNKYLSQKFMETSEGLYSVGQMVLAKILEIDQEKRRFVASLMIDQAAAAGHPLIQPLLGCRYTAFLLNQRDARLAQAVLHKEGIGELNDVCVGTILECRVMQVDSSFCRVKSANNLQGYIPLLEKTATLSEGNLLTCLVVDWNDEAMEFVALIAKSPTTFKLSKDALEVSQIVNAYIVHTCSDYAVAVLRKNGNMICYLSSKEHINSFVNTSSRFSTGQEVSCRIASVDGKYILLEEYDKPTVIHQGDVVACRVRSVKNLQVNLAIIGSEIHGRIHISEISDEPTPGFQLLNSFHQDQQVRARILGFRDMKTFKFLPISHRNFTRTVAELCIRPSIMSGPLPVERTLDHFTVGSHLYCFVKTITDHFVMVTVTTSVNGRIPVLSLSADPEVVLDGVGGCFEVGNCIKAFVVQVNHDHKALELTGLDPSKDHLSPGSVVPCCVLSHSIHGVWVRLPGSQEGFCHMTNVSDNFDVTLDESAPIGAYLRCSVIRKTKDKPVSVCLRCNGVEGSETPKDPVIQSVMDLEEGSIVRGFVKSISDAGVFVSLSENVVARAQIKNLSQYYIKDWKKLINVGSLVSCKVISVDPSKGHIELSLKGSDTGVEDLALSLGDTELHIKGSRKRTRNQSEGSTANQSGNHVEEVEEASVVKKPREDPDVFTFLEAPTLEAMQNGTNPPESCSDSSDEENDQVAPETKKLSLKQKKAGRRAEENLTMKTELALLDVDRGPESAADYDRLVLSSPNSSLLWIQYMAFHLGSMDIEKARKVANRALQTISFREDQEKLNVWVALLNLENMYGTAESLGTTLENALKVNSPKKVHLQMVSVYVKSNKMQMAEALYQLMLKKYASSKKVWTSYGWFLMKQGQLDQSRKLLQRALKSLPRRKHLDTIVKFSLMEFKHGDPQRGATIMEGVVKNYPKRTDLWSVYIDMALKSFGSEYVRQLFDRAVKLNLSAHKMKFLYKRYLEFETERGDADSVERVKQLAVAYVEGKNAS